MNKQEKSERVLKKKVQEETQKQPYHKPRLGRVSLFADQVLSLCKPDGFCPLSVNS